MAEKRRLSTRSKGESPLEKRIKDEEAAALLPKKPTTRAADKALKKKVTKIHARKRRTSNDDHDVHGGTSPTAAGDDFLQTTNDGNIEPQDLLSIAQSGVLASALQRSRASWTTDGIFTKYWTKPRTLKGKTVEPPGNPSKNSMKQLGKCRITVEPHVFDAVLYTINETVPNPNANAMSRPIMYYPSTSSSGTKPSSNSQSGQVGTPPLQNPSQYPPMQPARPSVPPPHTASTSTTAQAHSPQQSQRPKDSSTSASVIPQPLPVPNAASSSAQPPPQQPPNPPQAPTNQYQQTQDPVIHMLAQRASSNLQLKELMKIVANGSASKDQLTAFQRHIDELNGIIAQQRAAGLLPPAPSNPLPAPSTPQSQTARTYPLPTLSKPQLYPSQGPSPMSTSQSKQKPPPATITKATGIAIEFPPATERYLFPKHAVLELLPGGLRARASFLVVRRGASTGSTNLEAGRLYNEPISIIVGVDDSRTMHTIFSTLTTVEQIQVHMETEIARSERAEPIALGLQKPKSGDVGSADAAAGNVEHSKRKASSWDEQESLCEFCFKHLPKGSSKACQACSSLVERVKMKTAGSLTAFQLQPTHDTERHGPLNLTLQA